MDINITNIDFGSLLANLKEKCQREIDGKKYLTMTQLSEVICNHFKIKSESIDLIVHAMTARTGRGLEYFFESNVKHISEALLGLLSAGFIEISMLDSNDELILIVH